MHHITGNLNYYHEHSPANSCFFKVSNRNTRKRYEICSKLTIKSPERRQCQEEDYHKILTNVAFITFNDGDFHCFQI